MVLAIVVMKSLDGFHRKHKEECNDYELESDHENEPKTARVVAKTAGKMTAQIPYYIHNPDQTCERIGVKITEQKKLNNSTNRKQT